jgi:hypothetical protein
MPARSNMASLAPKSFCMSTTSTTVFAVSMVIASGVASIVIIRLWVSCMRSSAIDGILQHTVYDEAERCDYRDLYIFCSLKATE